MAVDVRVQLNIRLPAEDRRLLAVGALRCRMSLNEFVLGILQPAIEEADREDVAALERRSGSVAKSCRGVSVGEGVTESVTWRAIEAVASDGDDASKATEKQANGTRTKRKPPSVGDS